MCTTFDLAFSRIFSKDRRLDEIKMTNLWLRFLSFLYVKFFVNYQIIVINVGWILEFLPKHLIKPFYKPIIS